MFFAEAVAPLDAESLSYDRLTEKDYKRLSSLVSQETGIKLPPAKRVMLEGRLRRRVRALACNSLADYCRYLFEMNGLESELTHLIDVVTTNKTDFFREPQHFDWLSSKGVPSLLASRTSGMVRPLLKIWSAASSTGAEAYTAAMVLSELVRRDDSFRFSILGTDISTEVLEQAALAIYSVDMIAAVPLDLQRRYLMTAKKREVRKVRIVPELRLCARFMQLNLMDKTYPFDRDVDIIFLRNVLIYFERDTQQQVLQRLIGHLRPGGYIILGHSESMIGTTMRLNQVVPGVFQNVQ